MSDTQEELLPEIRIDPSIYYSRNCSRKTDAYRMMEDGEHVKHGDIVWSNGATSPLPASESGHFITLMMGTGSWWRIGHMFDGQPVAGFIPIAINYYNQQLKSKILSGGEIAKRTYSIWRPKIKLEKRSWQDTPLPIP